MSSIEPPRDDSAKEALRARVEQVIDSLDINVLEEVARRQLYYGKRAAVNRLRRAAPFIVPGSVAVAITGFSICVLHYHRRGVPIGALSYTQFLAAGVLYALLNGLAFCAGFLLSGKSWKQQVVLWISWTAAIGAAVGAVNLRGALSAAGYFGGLSAGVAMALGYGNRRGIKHVVRRVLEQHLAERDTPTEDDVFAEASRRITAVTRAPAGGLGRELLLIWVGTALAFATIVFPVVPAHLGGGASRRVRVVWDPAMSAEEREAIGLVQRCLFEVHADSEFMYLLSAPQKPDESCPRPVAFGDAAVKELRFTAIPRSRVRAATYLLGREE